jgi:DNA-binding transcriptional MerR regulator
VDPAPPGPDEQLLGIGVFARRSRLSLKALRLYDRLGLLVPADTDPVSGYRRYRERQLATARLIARLRQIDMPLAVVGQILAVPGQDAAERLAAYWEDVERRIAGQRGLALYLRSQLSGGEGTSDMFEIRTREVPAQRVLTEQRHVAADELPCFIGEATTRLLKAAEEFGGMAGPSLVVYHGEVSEDGDGPVEVCVPVEPPPGAETGHVALREEPGHREAYTRIIKAQVQFPQILMAYDAVSAWLAAHGHEATAAPREVYFADWTAVGPDDEVCDIAFPYA